MHRRAILTVALLSFLVAGSASAVASPELPATSPPVARASHVPSNFTRHTGPHWTWYGPHGWIDSQGKNDLVITDPVGDDTLHFGFSAAPCYVRNGGSALDTGKYFKKLRKSFNPSAFSLKPMRSGSYTKVGKTKHLPNGYYGPYGYRQADDFSAKTRSGHKLKGEMVLDYFYDPGSTSCGEAFVIRSAPKNAYHSDVKTMRKITQLITYKG